MLSAPALQFPLSFKPMALLYLPPSTPCLFKFTTITFKQDQGAAPAPLPDWCPRGPGWEGSGGGAVPGFWCYRADTPPPSPTGSALPAALQRDAWERFASSQTRESERCSLVRRLCACEAMWVGGEGGGSESVEERTAEDELVSRDEAEYPKSRKLCV